MQKQIRYMYEIKVQEEKTLIFIVVTILAKKIHVQSRIRIVDPQMFYSCTGSYAHCGALGGGLDL